MLWVFIVGDSNCYPQYEFLWRNMHLKMLVRSSAVSFRNFMASKLKNNLFCYVLHIICLKTCLIFIRKCLSTVWKLVKIYQSVENCWHVCMLYVYRPFWTTLLLLNKDICLKWENCLTRLPSLFLWLWIQWRELQVWLTQISIQNFKNVI